jgi:hypothetical protein
MALGVFSEEIGPSDLWGRSKKGPAPGSFGPSGRRGGKELDPEWTFWEWLPSMGVRQAQ